MSSRGPLSSRASRSLSLLALAAMGCGVAPQGAAAPRPGSALSPETLRARTIIVHVRAPERIAQLFDGLARGSAKRNDMQTAQFYATHAVDSFGSGFLVRHGGSTFIVTNRHVVDLSEDPEIQFDGVEGRIAAEVVYADPLYDLAILGFEAPTPARAATLELADAPPKDLDGVIATGFPALGGNPSYQSTRGQVSNNRLTFADRGVTLSFVQHTAPIDPGSSGGPLTNEAGQVVGANVMKFTGRDNVYLAVPVPAIKQALASAAVVLKGRESKEWLISSLAKACSALVGVLNAEDLPPDLPFSLANDLVAEKGFESIQLLERDRSTTKSDQEAIRTAFLESPLEVLRAAVAVRLWKEAHGPEGPPVTCAVPEQKGEPEDVRLTIQFAKGKRDTFWRFEQGHWKVSNFSGIKRTAPAKPPGKARRP